MLCSNNHYSNVSQVCFIGNPSREELNGIFGTSCDLLVIWVRILELVQLSLASRFSPAFGLYCNLTETYSCAIHAARLDKC